MIAKGVESLSESDRMILYLRFGRDLTQSEIAKRIGTSQMQVSRLLRAAIEKIRRVSGEDGRLLGHFLASTARWSWRLFMRRAAVDAELLRLVVELVAGAALLPVGARPLAAALARGHVLESRCVSAVATRRPGPAPC